MPAPTAFIFRGCLALLMVISSVVCACAAATVPTPASTTQPAEPPCCSKEHDAPANDQSPHGDHAACPHCTGKLTADAPTPVTAKHLADMPQIAVAIASLIDAPLPLNTPVLSSVLDTPFVMPAALPARLHCALVL